MEEKEVQGAPVHKRRVRYSGTHPKRFAEKYKEQNPEESIKAAVKYIAATSRSFNAIKDENERMNLSWRLITPE